LKNLKAEAISATSVKGVWDAPVKVHLDSKRYLLVVGEVRKEFPYNDFNGTYTIDGLTPGQKYKVLVRLSLQNPHYLAPAAEIDVET
uniref:Fibronectin type-III domain-containing protein n=1 Tax=Schistocephalus solidus TaxID=70667 RepID=A0A183SX62_SCHSO